MSRSIIALPDYGEIILTNSVAGDVCLDIRPSLAPKTVFILNSDEAEALAYALKLALRQAKVVRGARAA